MTDVRAGLSPGTVLGGYRVESFVARGGMGVVYRATQLALDRIVALKVVAPEFADDAGFRERFGREARLAASLDHPNILPIYEAGEVDGQLFLSMRFVEGTDLKSLIERARARPAARGGARRPGRQRARRGTQPRADSPRRQAGEHPDRAGIWPGAGVSGRFRPEQEPRRRDPPDPDRVHGRNP